MPRRPAVIAAPPPVQSAAARLRQLVAADGRPLAEIERAVGLSRSTISQLLRAPNMTVASVRRVLGGLRVVDPATGIQRRGRLGDLD
jgi:transcriptional regulator with XRE-family HTH domain